MAANNKVLLIRFSSFGDITQCLSVPTRLKELGPGTQVHWVTREDMAELLLHHPHIDQTWTLNRKLGLGGLLQLIKKLKQQNFTHIYDAHNNLRSHLICWLLSPPLSPRRWFAPPHLVRKSQKRWQRFLLFKFRKNFFRQPFSGQRDLLEPLSDWGLSADLPPTPQIFPGPPESALAQNQLQALGNASFIALAPAAAYELKRWPMDYWLQLIKLHPQENFVLLGGPEDHFLQALADQVPERVHNLAGKTSLLTTAAVVARAKVLIANDTGILHLGEQLGQKTLALMGPAPFGFPSRPSTLVLERSLKCRPCSKHGQGPCTNVIFQECLRNILPSEVSKELLKQLQ